MRIDGREIAREIFEDLKKRVKELKEKGVTPHLVVFLVGNDPASSTYVRQKERKAIEIGAKATIHHLPASISQEKLLSIISKLNHDSTVHGIIVQRPLPDHINEEKIDLAVDPKKDIDSFHPKSLYPMPLAKAVIRILKEIHCQITRSDLVKVGPRQGRTSLSSFREWLNGQKIVVIGKGKTGGRPTIQMFKKMGIKPQVIDSKTQNPRELTKDADIIISTVGKSNIVKPEMIKKGVILISVGLHQGEDEKLHGDYEESEIKDIASFYTPTPGGIGPVNVACLLENLLKAVGKKS